MRLQKLPNELKILQFFSLPNICAIIHYLISLIYFKINLKNNLKSQIAINSNEVFALTQSNIQILLCKEGIKENKHIFLLYIWLLYFWLFVSWAPCRQSCLFLDMLIKKDIHLSVWRWFLDCWTPPPGHCGACLWERWWSGENVLFHLSCLTSFLCAHSVTQQGGGGQLFGRKHCFHGQWGVRGLKKTSLLYSDGTFSAFLLFL